MRDDVVDIERLDEHLGARAEFLLPPLAFLGLGQDIDIPAGELGGEPHILPAPADRQRELLVGHDNLDAALLFVHHDFRDLGGRQRAQAWLEQQNEKLSLRRRELGVSEELAAIEGLNPGMLVTLGEAGVKTLDDLADLSTDELVDKKDGILRGHDLSRADAETMIMAARAHWFEGDEAKA
jgi:hypothetical protein